MEILGEVVTEHAVVIDIACYDTHFPSQQPTESPTQQPTEQPSTEPTSPPTLAPTELCTALDLTVQDVTQEESARNWSWEDEESYEDAIV